MAHEDPAGASAAGETAAWPGRSPWRRQLPRRPCHRQAARHMRVHARGSPPALPSGGEDETKCDRPVTVQHGRGRDLPGGDFAGQELWHNTIIVAGRTARGHPAPRATRAWPRSPAARASSRCQHAMSSENPVNSPAQGNYQSVTREIPPTCYTVDPCRCCCHPAAADILILTQSFAVSGVELPNAGWELWHARGTGKPVPSPRAVLLLAGWLAADAGTSDNRVPGHRVPPGGASGRDGRHAEATRR